MTQTARAAQIEAPGGPEAIKIVTREVGEPGPGQIRIRHTACGLNFLDTYHRSGLYPLPMPAVLGCEASGTVEAVGEGVTHLKPGDRAAYASVPPGAYTEARVMSAAQVAPLPDAVGFEEAAAIMLKGLTVEYIFERTTPIKPGDTVLFQAAAGGVGLLACQWARSEGIRLIGTAGSDEKCALAVENGADVCINYRTEDFVARVKELTGGKGVDVVMDGVGADTFEGGLQCLRPFGFMILFGSSSGVVPPFDIQRLAPLGCLKVTRPTVFAHIAKHEDAQAMAARLFEKMAKGDLTLRIDQRYPLEEVVEAHRALEARKTTGQTILTL